MNELEHELRIFESPTSLRVGEDWMPFPDELLVPTSTPVAEEILVLLSDEPVSDELRLWLSHLRGDVRNARAQDALFRGEDE